MLSSVAGNGLFDYSSYYAQGAERRNAGADSTPPAAQEKDETDAADVGSGQNSTARKPNGEPLTESDQAQIRELESIDRKVRQHEQAHMAAGGALVTSSASYSYTEGPDGKRYATGGEVGIDTSPGRTPEETLTRARQIRSAALAPADPSPQDRSVAAAASQMEMQALQEIAQQQQEAARGEGEDADLPAEAGSATHDSGIGKSGRGEAAIQAYQSMMFGAIQDTPQGEPETRGGFANGFGKSGAFVSAYA
ncbi:MAG: hypothetical protein LBQ81_10100 [Zoogloeaceae bacterium]|jgi:hypothetical protein|nr:hypothetical protein [Zoogloeaceae bacterium]